MEDFELVVRKKWGQGDQEDLEGRRGGAVLLRDRISSEVFVTLLVLGKFIIGVLYGNSECKNACSYLCLFQCELSVLLLVASRLLWWSNGPTWASWTARIWTSSSMSSWFLVPTIQSPRHFLYGLYSHLYLFAMYL